MKKINLKKVAKNSNLSTKDKSKVFLGHMKKISGKLYSYLVAVIGLTIAVAGVLSSNAVLSYSAIAGTVGMLSLPNVIFYIKNFKTYNLEIRENVKVKETKKAIKKVEVANKTIQGYKKAETKKNVKEDKIKSNQSKIERTVISANIDAEKDKFRKEN